jgi:hypothetical protein
LKDAKLLTLDSIPCWYELSRRKLAGQDFPCTVLRIHKDFVAANEKICPDCDTISRFLLAFGFRRFCGRFGEDFGFEHALKFAGETDSFLEYSIPPDSGKAYAVSATLTLVFEFMRYPEIETSAALPQLMTLETITLKTSGGGYIGGEYGKEMAAYLRSRHPGPIPQISEAMRESFQLMTGCSPAMPNGFLACTQGANGWLNIKCTGRSGLCPANCHANGQDAGYEFVSYGIDTPQQQIACVAGLAALHDLARAVFVRGEPG